ncbi:Hypothetical predicted protein, partial [Marmota monax]
SPQCCHSLLCAVMPAPCLWQLMQWAPGAKHWALKTALCVSQVGAAARPLAAFWALQLWLLHAEHGRR